MAAGGRQSVSHHAAWRRPAAAMGADRLALPQPRCRGLIQRKMFWQADLLVGALGAADGDAVVAGGGFDADVAVQHVVQYRRGVALQGISVATAPRERRIYARGGRVEQQLFRISRPAVAQD